MNQSFQEGTQQGSDGLFRKPQTELEGEGQGGQIFSALAQAAAVVRTHAQSSILWTAQSTVPLQEPKQARDSALC